MAAILFRPQCVNSLATSNTIWLVLAVGLMAPRRYLNQRWFNIQDKLSQLLNTWGQDKMAAIWKTTCIFFDENVWISINISVKFIPEIPIDDIPVLFQRMT